ncbi:MAG: hypothetical protein D6719_10235 [Candidatus Dadabacteria bacterium]|nr:MAG: hypothetical protein D6719_10235 [Candidatus Dadabacteria bacterium]
MAEKIKILTTKLIVSLIFGLSITGAASAQNGGTGGGGDLGPPPDGPPSGGVMDPMVFPVFCDKDITGQLTMTPEGAPQTPGQSGPPSDLMHLKFEFHSNIKLKQGTIFFVTQPGATSKKDTYKIGKLECTSSPTVSPSDSCTYTMTSDEMIAADQNFRGFDTGFALDIKTGLTPKSKSICSAIIFDPNDEQNHNPSEKMECVYTDYFGPQYNEQVPTMDITYRPGNTRELNITAKNFAPNQILRGCLQGPDGKFQEVFHIKIFETTNVSNNEVYGKFLKKGPYADEFNELAQKKEYNYDQYNPNSSLSTLVSLGTIGLGNIAATLPAANTARKEAKKRDRKKRKRKKRGKRRRGNSARMELFVSGAKGIKRELKADEPPQQVIAFDPMGAADQGILLIVPNSCKNAESQAYGDILCSPNVGNSVCTNLTNLQDTSKTGSACREVFNDATPAFTDMFVNISGAPAGTYYVCLDGTAISKSFQVNEESQFGEAPPSDPAAPTPPSEFLFTFGELPITNDQFRQNDPYFAYTNIDLSAVTNVRVVKDPADCATFEVDGNFQ